MDKQTLYDIDFEVNKKIQMIRADREAETKAYINGLEAGADMMMKAVKNQIEVEEKKKRITESDGSNEKS